MITEWEQYLCVLGKMKMNGTLPWHMVSLTLLNGLHVCVYAHVCAICAGACTNMYMEVKEGCPLSLSSLSFKAESLSQTEAFGFQLRTPVVSCPHRPPCWAYR